METLTFTNTVSVDPDEVRREIERYEKSIGKSYSIVACMWVIQRLYEAFEHDFNKKY